MKIRKYQTDEERSILTGMIVSTRVLARIYTISKLEKRPFQNKWSNLVGQWCLDFYSKYEKAPKGSIRTMFTKYAESTHNADGVELIEKFLESLSEDYAALSRETNEDYLVDLASRHFNKIRIERQTEAIQGDLLDGDVEIAMGRFASFTPFSFSTTSMVGVFTDRSVWRDALEGTNGECLIQYPGAMGEFLNPHFERDGFIAFMGPEKRGKSWWLIDAAWRASVMNRRRTLLYSVGDMSQRQMMRRLIVRAAKRPLRAGEVTRPIGLRRRQGGEVKVSTQVQNFERPLSLKDVRRAMARIQRKSARKDSLLKLKCTSNSSTRVADIQRDVRDLARDGWDPEVLVVDYADILAPERALSDYRHQVDETWKALRRLSQDFHCLVITGTQSNAASAEQEVVRRKHFSEDKRKLAHVTGMIGINQTEEEKSLEIYRLNWILVREGTYYESRCITVAGCLALGNPALFSIA